MRRRDVLKLFGTAAGAALLGPWARQALATGGTPKRFVFVVEGNGIDPVTFMSPATRLAIDAQSTSSTTGRRQFSNAYGHTAPIVVPAGDLASAPAMTGLAAGMGTTDLSTRAQVVLGLSSKITGGGHTTNFGALSSTRSTSARAGGPTIDAVLAADPGIRDLTPFDCIRVGMHGSSAALGNSTCAYDVGRSAPILMSPTLAYDNVFGSVSGGSAFARQGSLLDYAVDDVNAALAQVNASQPERAKLEAYLASLEALETRRQTLLSLQPTLAAVAPADPSVNPLYSSSDPLDALQAQMDLVTSALIGGLTNVAVVASATGYPFDIPYPSLIADITRHSLHHGAADPAWLSVIQTATRMHVDMVAGMARALDAVPEGNGTMLDNTLIVFMSDNGEQHHSQAIEWPVLLVGGSNMGFFSDGRTTVFPSLQGGAGHRQMSNLFNTIGHAAGLGLDDFGDEGTTRVALGPLSELRT